MKQNKEVILVVVVGEVVAEVEEVVAEILGEVVAEMGVDLVVEDVVEETVVVVDVDVDGEHLIDLAWLQLALVCIYYIIYLNVFSSIKCWFVLDYFIY